MSLTKVGKYLNQNTAGLAFLKFTKVHITQSVERGRISAPWCFSNSLNVFGILSRHQPELRQVRGISGLEVFVKRLFFAAVVLGLCIPALSAFADTLELRNGSVIKGIFIGGSEAQISFRVGSSLQRYPVADVVAIRFDSDSTSSGNYGNSGD